MLPKGTGLLLFVWVAGCGGPGSSTRPISLVFTGSEALAGQRAAGPLEQRFGGVLNDPQALRRMEPIGERLASHVDDPSIRWRISLLAGEQINAFSLPGGLIYLTRGLYDRIGPHEHLLAAVIAHEMGHVLRRDGLKPKPGCTAEALDREIAADRLGTSLLVAAGYPSDSMKELLGLVANVQPTGWARVRLDRLDEAKRDRTAPYSLLATR